MKWKNNIVILIAYFIGRIYGFAIDEQFNKIVNNVVDCQSICSKDYNKEKTNLKNNMCTCPEKSDFDSTLLYNAKLVPLHHKVDIKEKYEITEEHNGGNKIKRQTILELINKRNKMSRTPNKSLKLLPTVKPATRWNVNNKYFQKPQAKSKTSGRLSNKKQLPRLKNIEDRIKDFKERMSTKPRFQARDAFPEPSKSKDLIKQLTERREELLKDFKALNSRSTVGKDSNILKERVGSTNHLHNQIDNIATSLKDKLKQRAEDKKNKSESKIETKKNEAKEMVGDINKKSTTSTETPKLTTPIPEIILGQTESAAPKAEVIESSTKKIETMSTALEKIMEKQKEAVMKIKDKLSVAKNKSKNLEVNDLKPA